MKTYVTIIAIAAAAAACDRPAPSDTTHITSTTVNGPGQATDPAGAPMVQGSSMGDIETTRRVQGAITDDTALSSEAKDISIVTSDGVVQLRGAVKTEGERQALEVRARDAAGLSHRVDNQIELMMMHP